MSIVFNRSVIIANPVEEVFRFVADPSSMSHIMPDIVRSEKIGDGPTKVELEATIQARGIGKLLVPLFRSSMKKQDSEQLSNLKAFLEEDF